MLKLLRKKSNKKKKETKKESIKVKVNGVYYANNKDLKLKYPSGTPIKKGGHGVIITAINPKRKTAQVKTITSLIDKDHPSTFKRKMVEKIDSGQILPIPKKDLNSKHLSGIVQKPITIPLSKLGKSSCSFKYPKRYDKLIHRK